MKQLPQPTLVVGVGASAGGLEAFKQLLTSLPSAHTAKLLDGLLDVSRIVRGKIQLEREVIDLAAICRQVVADVAPKDSATRAIRTNCRSVFVLRNS